jgi:hypothetical protein
MLSTLLLSVLPMLSILAVFVYAVVTGARMYRSSGRVSVIGIAVVLAGFVTGRLLDRLTSLPADVDDWVNYRGGAALEVATRGDRGLALLSVESAVMFVLAAVVVFLAVTLVRREEAEKARSGGRSLQLPLLATLFVLAVALLTRSKLAAIVAFYMAKAHLL